MTIRVERATARHVAAEFTMELAVAAEAMDKGAVSVSTGRLLDEPSDSSPKEELRPRMWCMGGGNTPE